ncbi:HpcH/HpaI aldolase/citrate lyase family protein [Streptomyces hirsutus]
MPFLEALTVAEATGGHRLFAMPVLESPELLYRESRVETLEGILRAVEQVPRPGPRPAPRRDRLLLPYGLRRGPDMTAYDLQIVASVIADVVNMLARVDGTGFTVTGPVWEYFRVQERMFKPQLRQSPFLEVQAVELRQSLIEHAMDGLLREISLDRANGLQGQDLHPPLPTSCPCTRCPSSATRSTATPRTSCGRNAAAAVS